MSLAIFELLRGRGTLERERLHSLGFKIHARIFAVLLVGMLPQLAHRQTLVAAERGVARAIIEGALLLALLVSAIFVVWSACPAVIATRAGLEVGRGQKLRIVPWDSVHDVREMPWIRMSPPWYPKRFQVDLVGGKAFEFVGVPNAREIVLEFWRRSRSA